MLATRSCLPQKPFTEAQGFPEAGGQTSPALRWAHEDRAQGHCASNLLWREACQADEKGGQPQAPQDGLISKVNRVCPRIFDLVFLPLPRNPSFSDLSQDGICGVSLEEAVKKLQDAGYLSNPSRCPACGRGCLGDLFRYGKNEDLVGRKCTQWDCRARFNALNLNQALPDQLGRSFRADQLYAAIKMYTDSGVSRHALHGLHCLFCKYPILLATGRRRPQKLQRLWASPAKVHVVSLLLSWRRSDASGCVCLSRVSASESALSGLEYMLREGSRGWTATLPQFGLAQGGAHLRFRAYASGFSV